MNRVLRFLDQDLSLFTVQYKRIFYYVNKRIKFHHCFHISICFHKSELTAPIDQNALQLFYVLWSIRHCQIPWAIIFAIIGHEAGNSRFAKRRYPWSCTRRVSNLRSRKLLQEVVQWHLDHTCTHSICFYLNRFNRELLIKLKNHSASGRKTSTPLINVKRFDVYCNSFPVDTYRLFKRCFNVDRAFWRCLEQRLSFTCLHSPPPQPNIIL